MSVFTISYDETDSHRQGGSFSQVKNPAQQIKRREEKDDRLQFSALQKTSSRKRNGKPKAGKVMHLVKNLHSEYIKNSLK